MPTRSLQTWFIERLLDFYQTLSPNPTREANTKLADLVYLYLMKFLLESYKNLEIKPQVQVVGFLF